MCWVTRIGGQSAGRFISTTFSGNIGLPLPSIDIAIKDDDGNSVPQGEPGEICIRGPNVMTGYYNQPEENAKAFTADGFMRTGDIGIMDPTLAFGQVELSTFADWQAFNLMGYDITLPEPDLMPAASFRKKVAGGVFVTKV